MRGVWLYTKIVICTTILAVGFKPFLLYREANTHCEATGLEAKKNTAVLSEGPLFPGSTISSEIVPANINISTLAPLESKYTNVSNLSFSTNKEKLYIQEQICAQKSGVSSRDKALAYLENTEEKVSSEQMQNDSKYIYIKPNVKDDSAGPQKEEILDECSSSNDGNEVVKGVCQTEAKVYEEDPKGGNYYLKSDRDIPELYLRDNPRQTADDGDGSMSVQPTDTLESVDTSSPTHAKAWVPRQGLDTSDIRDGNSQITDYINEQIDASEIVPAAPDGIEPVEVVVDCPAADEVAVVDNEVVSTVEAVILNEDSGTSNESAAVQPIDNISGPVAPDSVEPVEVVVDNPAADEVAVVDIDAGSPTAPPTIDSGDDDVVSTGEVVILDEDFGTSIGAPNAYTDLELPEEIYDLDTIVPWEFIVSTNDVLIYGGELILKNMKNINIIRLRDIVTLGLYKIEEIKMPAIDERTGKHIYKFYFDKSRIHKSWINKIIGEYGEDKVDSGINFFIKRALDNFETWDSEYIFKFYKDKEEFVTTSFDLCEDIIDSVLNGESIIKWDFGVDGVFCNDAYLLPEAIRWAIEEYDTIFIASAGNSNSDANGHMPANLSGVLSVTAVDQFGNPRMYEQDESTRANIGTSVAVAAPGEKNGTANACNEVEEIIKKIKDKFPYATREEIILRIIGTSNEYVKGTDIPIVNEKNALSERFSPEDMAPKFVLLDIRNEKRGKDEINPGDFLRLRIYIKNLGRSIDGQIHGIIEDDADVEIYNEAVYGSSACLGSLSNDFCFEMRISEDIQSEKLRLNLVLEENGERIGAIPFELNVIIDDEK